RINNKPQLGVHDYLNMASLSAQKNDIQKTLKYLGKASELRLVSEVIKEHPDIEIKPTILIPPIPKNKAIQDAYSSYLRAIDYEKLKKDYASRWAKIYYTLGLLAYEQNKPELVVPFWEIAVNLGPEWSYLHVELANFYLIQGKVDSAKAIIEYCLTFEYPKDYCQEYLDNNIKSNSPEPVGTWEEKINKEI
ncbi:MAG: hypothetical protein ACC618_03980, partial [Patescibacteria group bacterium]